MLCIKCTLYVKQTVSLRERREKVNVIVLSSLYALHSYWIRRYVYYFIKECFITLGFTLQVEVARGFYFGSVLALCTIYFSICLSAFTTVSSKNFVYSFNYIFVEELLLEDDMIYNMHFLYTFFLLYTTTTTKKRVGMLFAILPS